MFEKILSFLSGLGIAQDVFENTRKTSTGVPNNKPKKREYGYSGEGTENIPKSRAEYQNQKKASKQVEEDDGRDI